MKPTFIQSLFNANSHMQIGKFHITKLKNDEASIRKDGDCQPIFCPIEELEVILNLFYEAGEYNE